MAVYPVDGTQVVQLSQSITGQALIQNVGASSIYMGNDTSVSSLNFSLFLPAGATVNYDGGDLFAICAPGQTSRIGIQYGANTSLTPGPSTVGINGPVQAIGTSVMLSSTDPGPGIPQTVDVSPYNTLQVTWNQASAYSVAGTPGIRVQWFDVTGIQLIATDEVSIAYGTVGELSLRVKGSKATVYYFGPSPMGQFRIYGLTGPVTTEYCSSTGNPGVVPTGNRFASFTGSLPSLTTFSAIPPYISGKAVLNAVWVGVSNIGNGVLLRMIDLTTGLNIAAAPPVFSAVSPNAISIPIIVPRAPIQLAMDNNTAGTLTSVALAIVYEGK